MSEPQPSALSRSNPHPADKIPPRPQPGASAQPRQAAAAPSRDEEDEQFSELLGIRVKPSRKVALKRLSLLKSFEAGQDVTQQQMLDEALDDLFTKYNV